MAISPTLTNALSAGAGIAGYLSNTNGARTATTTPTFTPTGQSVSDILSQRLLQKLNNPVNVGAGSGYEINGLQGINDVFKGLKMSADNNLTSRGLSTSPVAATVGTNLDLARGGQMADFLNNEPLVQNQLDQQNISDATNFLGTQRGSTSTAPGSSVASGIGSAAEMLAYLHGKAGAAMPAAGGILGGAAPSAVAAGVPDLGAIAAGTDILGGAAPSAVAAAAPDLGAAATAAGGVPSTTVGGGLIGGLESAAHFLTSNPWTIGVAGAVAGIAALLKSQAHWEANTWVKGFQNPFDQNMGQLNQQFFSLAQSGQLNKAQATQIRNSVAQAAQAYKQKLDQFATQGSDNVQVAKQAQQTADLAYGPNFGKTLGAMDNVIAGLR